MIFDRSNGTHIYKGQKIKVKSMNHVVEVMSVLFDSGGLQTIRKLSKEQYVVLESGEILDYKLNENRGQNVAGLKDTFKKIRDLINNNFVGAPNELFVTLTYKENMTDPKILYRDFESFWKRFKRKYGKAEYLSIIEPQGRGAWHCHVLIRFSGTDRVYIPAKEIETLWGKGFIKIKGLDNVDNIGAYISAYLGDAEATDEWIEDNMLTTGNNNWQLVEKEVDGIKKKFIKGGRLHMYPSGMNLYRKSKGIIFPEVVEMKYLEFKKIVGYATPNYSETISIIDEETGKTLNKISYENYNMKRRILSNTQVK